MALRRGRRPLRRDISGLAELLVPSEVVLDTSLVVEALFPQQPHRDECITSLERVAEAGSVLWFNELLEVELYESTFRLVLEERWGKKRAGTMRYDGRGRGRASRLLAQVSRAWEELLGANNWAVVELGEVTEFLPRLMTDYGVSAKDAVHAATALYADVLDLATLDTGLANVPGLRIHTNAARVHVCRRHRATAARRGIGTEPPTR